MSHLGFHHVLAGHADHKGTASSVSSCSGACSPFALIMAYMVQDRSMGVTALDPGRGGVRSAAAERSPFACSTASLREDDADFVMAATQS